MRCAKCNDRQLEQFSRLLTPPSWICSACGGVWIPDGKAVGAKPPEDVGEMEARSEADAKAGLCPQGHGLLTRAQTHIAGGFFLERCSTCLGVWFDRGEWHAVAGAGLGAGLFAIWTDLWQRDQMRARSSQAYEQQLQQELGSVVITKINSLADELDTHPSRSLALGYLLGRIRGGA